MGQGNFARAKNSSQYGTRLRSGRNFYEYVVSARNGSFSTSASANDGFKGLIDRRLPDWQNNRKALNHAPPTLWISPEINCHALQSAVIDGLHRRNQ